MCGMRRLVSLRLLLFYIVGCEKSLGHSGRKITDREQRVSPGSGTRRARGTKSVAIPADRSTQGRIRLAKKLDYPLEVERQLVEPSHEAKIALGTGIESAMQMRHLHPCLLCAPFATTEPTL